MPHHRLGQIEESHWPLKSPSGSTRRQIIALPLSCTFVVQSVHGRQRVSRQLAKNRHFISVGLPPSTDASEALNRRACSPSPTDFQIQGRQCSRQRTIGSKVVRSA